MEYKEIKAEIFQDSPNNFWGQAFVDDHQVGLLVFTGSSMEEIEANFKTEVDKYLQYSQLTHKN